MYRLYVGDTIAHTAPQLRPTIGVALIGIFALTSCAQDDSTAQEDQTATVEPSDAEHGDVLVAEVDEPVEFETCTKAEELPGATVEWLDDVVIEEQRIEAVASQTVEIDGEQIDIPGMPELVIPEIVGQAGCVIEYAAPGGCLPAVEISGSHIPGYRIPERTLPAVELPDGTVLEEEVQEAIESEPISQEGEFQEQVCQTEEDAADSDYVAHVIRPHIMRSHIMAPHQTASSINRSSTITDGGDSIPAQLVSSYQVPSISVGSANVESGYLESYRVEGADHTEYTEDDQVTSYTTEGDVLFDSDDHELRSDAEAELQAIADDIALRDGEYTITVEGHTDDLPTQEYADNTDLSEQRAESVVAWLQDNADVAADDITADGMGDEHPRASNDSEDGRQENRRVVITVTPTNYEPDIDYEVEDSEDD